MRKVTFIMLGSKTQTHERLWRPVEVASFLQVSRATAYNLIRTGALPSIRIGGAIRVLPRDVERYLTEHRQGEIRTAASEPEAVR